MSDVFKPAWWLPTSHLQTVWPTLSNRKILLTTKRERFELPDGDFVDLDWCGSSDGPLIFILHGLGGSANSPYAKGIMKACSERGWRVVLMHFRGCSGHINRLPRTYHSGETEDFDTVLKAIVKREQPSKVAAIGYSLGGNVLLKWLGENHSDNPLTAAVAVSVPMDLPKAADRMQQGFSKIYQWYLIRGLRQNIQKKFSLIDSPISLDNITHWRNFWEFDDKVTAPLHGFNGVYDYYHQASSRRYIKNIKTPTLIIHAKDDPFMTQDVIPKADELSDYTQLLVSEKGGHVGFISGHTPGRAEYWLEQRIPNYLAEALE
tara:strand:+ start:26239 stop:27195 length:957 start_codon:yes stop_codon:yes gene_type:complete